MSADRLIAPRVLTLNERKEFNTAEKAVDWLTERVAQLFNDGYKLQSASIYESAGFRVHIEFWRTDMPEPPPEVIPHKKVWWHR